MNSDGIEELIFFVLVNRALSLAMLCSWEKLDTDISLAIARERNRFLIFVQIFSSFVYRHNPLSNNSKREKGRYHTLETCWLHYTFASGRWKGGGGIWRRSDGSHRKSNFEFQFSRRSRFIESNSIQRSANLARIRLMYAPTYRLKPETSRQEDKSRAYNEIFRGTAWGELISFAEICVFATSDCNT